MGVSAKRTMVLGLDSTPPRLVFDEYLSDLPTFRRLMEEGAWGPLESTIPPITVPAWTCMMTGKNAGWHGCFGFRNRKRGAYDDMWIANARTIREPKVWDILGRSGRRVCALGVPQTYPPSQVNGALVSCFLTPGQHAVYRHFR